MPENTSPSVTIYYRAISESESKFAKISSKMTVLRSFLINLLFFVAFIAVAILTFGEFRKLQRSNLIIDPIHLPKKLHEGGYSGDAAAQWLRDAIHEIRLTSEKSKSPFLRVREFKSNSREIGKVSILSNLSSDSVYLTTSDDGIQAAVPESMFVFSFMFKYIKEYFFSDKIRISGRVYCDLSNCAPEKLQFELRIINDRNQIIPLPAMGSSSADKYFKNAAVEVLKLTDPYRVALYHYESDKDQALQTANDMIKDNHPHTKWALNLVGLVHANRKNYDQAIEFYKKSIERDPSFFLPHMNWGVLLSIKGDYKGSLRKFEDAGNLNANYARLFMYWGKSLYSMSKYDESNLKYREANNIDPNDEVILFNWANSLAKQKKYSDAGKKYEMATNIDKKYAAAYFNWGDILLEEKKFDQAIIKYNKVIEIFPDKWPAYYNLGIALMNVNDDQGASKQFTRVTSIFPSFAPAYVNLAAIFRRMGDHEAALQKYEKVISLNPDWAEMYYEKGVMLARLDRTREASTAFESYLKFDPSGYRASEAREWMKKLSAPTNSEKTIKDEPVH